MRGIHYLQTCLILNFQLYLDNHKIRLHILLNQKINIQLNIRRFLQELKILMLLKIFSNIPFFPIPPDAMIIPMVIASGGIGKKELSIKDTSPK